MKLNFRLSLIVIIIVVVIVVTVAIVLLQTASGMAINLNTQIIESVGHDQASFWENREESRMTVLRTIANQFSDYESIPVEQRRERFDDVLRSEEHTS